MRDYVIDLSYKVRLTEPREAIMRKVAGLGIFVGVIASALLSDLSMANAQTDGAVQ